LWFGNTVENDPTHGESAIEVPGLRLIAQSGTWRGRLRSRWLLLGNQQLEYGLRRNALQGSVEQKKPVEDGLAQGQIRLL
jgi:hypothetical protein